MQDRSVKGSSETHRQSLTSINNQTDKLKSIEKEKAQEWQTEDTSLKNIKSSLGYIENQVNVRAGARAGARAGVGAGAQVGVIRQYIQKYY